LFAIEVKVNTSRLSKLQVDGGAVNMNRVLRNSLSWSKPTAGSKALAQAVRDRIQAGETVKGLLVKVDLNMPGVPVTFGPW
jgi:hypothetical protein